MKHQLTKAILSIAVASTTSTQVSAEEQQIETIKVLGTKFEQSLMDVAESVAVVTAEELNREPIADLYDVVERIPNVTTSFGEQGFSIRGIDQRGVGAGGNGNGNTITVYVDDAPLGNQTTFFGPTGSWDVSQIEVYRGPQSTNFGCNALAGAIYIRTQDPSYDFDLKLRAEVADYDTYQVSAAGGGAIIEDKLAFRLSGDYRESDGFIDNVFLNTPADDTELSNIRGKLLFEPSDTIKIITTTTYAENYAGEDLVDVDNNGNYTTDVAYDLDGREGTETFLQAINATWILNENWDIQSISSYQSTDYMRIEDFDVSTELPGESLDRTGKDKATSQEVRLRYQNEKLQAVLGTYYVNTDRSFDSDYIVKASIINSAIPPSILVQSSDQNQTEVNNYALFFDGRYAITEKFTLLFGARYDNEKSESNGQTNRQFITDLPPSFEFLRAYEGSTSQESDAEFNAFLPKAGLQYAVTDSTNMTLQAQRGYRAGGSQISVLDGSIIDFDPEFITNYELSTRSQLLDGALVLNTNIFHSDWSDQQVAVPFSDTARDQTRTVNAGESTLRGLEISLDYKATNTLDVYGSMGYVKTEFDKFESTVNGETRDFAGNRFPFAPKLSANIGFDQRHGNGVFYGVDVNYRSDMYSDNENASVNELDEVTVVNARLGYEFGTYYRVTAYARNLFDEEYLSTLSTSVDGSGAITERTGRLGDPRVIGLRFNADF